MNNYSKSCTCDGSNENCCYCFGTGVVQGRLPLAGGAPSPPRRKKPAKQSQPLNKVTVEKGIVSNRLGSIRKIVRVKNGTEARLVEVTRNGMKMVQCPKCVAVVKLENVGRHNHRVHFMGSVPRRKKMNRPKQSGIRFHQKAGGESESSLVVPLTRQEHNRMETRLDTTRDYAHAFRETGRFGSHPSHDGFDDESSPE